MLYALLKTIHVLSVILWVGGMIFAELFLRPALAALAPPERLRLTQAVLARFFTAVLWASALALGSGVWMIGRVAKAAVQSGGSFSMPLSWTVMAGLGVLMVALFGYIRFVLYPRFAATVAAADWTQAAERLQPLRLWVRVNLVIGLVIVGVLYLAH
ncbi:MAG: CopD family protein [Rhodocyclaceae bacterium]|nr:CopD family protein [Rhodocyclaceae bacterium]MDZ4213725.1 CopD family protein [Rhodocyclaceae bacterium]